ncbi:hypothetical protein [Crossiella sp. CA198]|uniref:hypothetical protein n=1 Tax=Crossiella sp. CA198 TaxID=3455607 RepID=UPI003F8D6404
MTDRSTTDFSTDPPRGADPRRVLVLGATVLVVLATLFAGWYGVSWAVAGSDDGLDYARERDEVVLVGQQHVVNLLHQDYRKYDEIFEQLKSATTSPLSEALAADKEATKKYLNDRKLVTTAKARESALTELDLRAGKAKMLAIVELTGKSGEEQPQVSTGRVAVELTRTPDGWRLSALDAVRPAPAV